MQQQELVLERVVVVGARAKHAEPEDAGAILEDRGDVVGAEAAGIQGVMLVTGELPVWRSSRWSPPPCVPTQSWPARSSKMGRTLLCARVVGSSGLFS